MPSQLRLIKSGEPRLQFRADAWLRLAGAVVCGLMAMGFTVIGYAGSLLPVLAGPLAAASLLWAAYLALIFVARRSERYTLTASRLTIERGILGKRYEQVELRRIREVLIEQTLVERLRATGRLELVARDATQPSIVLGPVVQAQAFHDHLLAAMPEWPARARDSR
jgi:membrane protein YdbS with pleckstrin-like domain